MMEVGRLCMKIAGRDANKICVVIETYEDNHVLVDGETRRKKCNIKHLEPMNKVIKIKEKASRDDVKKAFTELGLGFFEPKSKKPEARVKRTKTKKESEKPKKTETKKAETKKETEKPKTETKKDEKSKK